MSGIEAAEALMILAVFLGGIVVGAMVIVSVAVKREDRRYSLSGAAPDFAARGTRLLIRVGCRGERVWERWR